jgi:hypothetical protein
LNIFWNFLIKQKRLGLFSPRTDLAAEANSGAREADVAADWSKE